MWKKWLNDTRWASTLASRANKPKKRCNNNYEHACTCRTEVAAGTQRNGFAVTGHCQRSKAFDLFFSPLFGPRLCSSEAKDTHTHRHTLLVGKMTQPHKIDLCLFWPFLQFAPSVPCSQGVNHDEGVRKSNSKTEQKEKRFYLFPFALDRSAMGYC